MYTSPKKTAYVPIPTSAYLFAPTFDFPAPSFDINCAHKEWEEFSIFVTGCVSADLDREKSDLRCVLKMVDDIVSMYGPEVKTEDITLHMRNIYVGTLLTVGRVVHDQDKFAFLPVNNNKPGNAAHIIILMHINFSCSRRL